MRVLAVLRKPRGEVAEYVSIDERRLASREQLVDVVRQETARLRQAYGLPQPGLELFEGDAPSLEAFFAHFYDVKLTERSIHRAFGRAPQGPPPEPDLMALDVYHLITALSDYERGLGGQALRLHAKVADQDAVTLTLAPVLVQGAAERLTRVAELVTGRTPTSRDSGGPPTTLLIALERTLSFPAERAAREVARLPWAITARVAA